MIIIIIIITFTTKCYNTGTEAHYYTQICFQVQTQCSRADPIHQISLC